MAEMGENTKKKKFLMGESLGGAVVLLLQRKKPDFWDGGILIAPMCKVNIFTCICLLHFIKNHNHVYNNNVLSDRLLSR